MVAVASVGIKLQTGDAVQKLRALATQSEKTHRALGGFTETAKQTQQGFGGLGAAARGLVPSLGAVGTAMQAALGPIAAVTSAVGLLTQGFQTLNQQNFSEAKVRSLGVNSEELRARLVAVSRELNGQASVAELTASAYDVASAGFTNAADAALILKAASLGATGGFSDINTVADAATSVLNAYGASAQDAGLLIDGFIQTQNDGKIVVAEYAANIAKVSSVAAGLKIPITEVNAAIAQSTAAGVQAEVAFTGLKAALARLASGEAAKALKGYGIDISAASIASDGLLGTLKKLQGLDTGTLLKALGTEAGPALLPVIQNLEKYEQLIKNQQNAAGASAEAQQQASLTIEGGLNRIRNAIQNVFSDQSELGAALAITFQAVGVTLEAVGAAIKVMMAPFRVLFGLLQGIGEALAAAFGVENVDLINLMSGAWADFLKNLETGIAMTVNVAKIFGQTFGKIVGIITTTFGEIGNIISSFAQELGVALSGPIATIQDAWTQFTEFITGSWSATTETVSGVWSNTVGFVGGLINQITEWWNGMTGNVSGQASWLGGFVNSVWNGISGGVQSVIGAITGAFANAFNGASAIISSWYNSLPAWLRGALSAATSAAGAVFGAVTTALNKVGGEIKAAGAALSKPIAVPQVKSGGGGAISLPVQSAMPSGGGGGRGAGAGRSRQPEKDVTPELKAELELKRQLFDLNRKIFNASLANNQAEVDRLNIVKIQAKLEDEIRQVNASNADSEDKILRITLLRLDASEQRAKISEAEAKRQDSQAKQAAETLQGLEQQRAKLEAILAGKGQEFELNQQIKDILKQNEGIDEQRVRDLVEGNAELEKQYQYLQQLNEVYKSIGDAITTGIVDSLTAAVEGTKTLAEIASDTLRSIGNILIQFGVRSLLGGLGGGDPNSIFTKIFGGARAGGGRVSSNRSYVVGERGPELFVPRSSGTIVPNNALGGGTANVTVNVDASGSNVQGDNNQASQLGKAIGIAVQAELVKQKRPGGLLAGT